MAKVKGIDVVLKIGANTLGGQRNATLNRSAELIEVTDKTSTGQWKENVSGYKEWSVDCDGLYVVSDTAYGALVTAFNAGTAVTITLTDSSTITYTGSAYITDFPLEAPYDDAVTYSVSLTGTGALS
jgi:TP901-1 family phage major tail protein